MATSYAVRAYVLCILLGESGDQGPPGPSGLKGERGQKGNHNTTLMMSTL